jgi:aminoglycoside 3-N-acetyltransferase
MTAASAYDYDRAAMIRAYADVGVAPGRVIYVTGDLGRLRRYQSSDKTEIVAAHYAALRELLGASGTLVVPAATLHLCNTDIVFDPATTPSHNMGPLAEFVRTRSEAVRSMHPFWSHAGVGPQAGSLFSDVSRHAYGYDSGWSRLVDADCLGIHVGRHPRHTISLVHHVEAAAGVPYRYTKEFMHPVRREGAISVEPFYLSVIYRGLGEERDRNRRIMEHYAGCGTMAYAPLGATGVWSVPFRAFFKITGALLGRDPYAWLAEPPKSRPYQT